MSIHIQVRLHGSSQPDHLRKGQRWLCINGGVWSTGQSSQAARKVREPWPREAKGWPAIIQLVKGKAAWAPEAWASPLSRAAGQA